MLANNGQYSTRRIHARRVLLRAQDVAVGHRSGCATEPARRKVSASRQAAAHSRQQPNDVDRLSGLSNPTWTGWTATSRRRLLNYFFAPRIASFATLKTRNLITVLAGILIFCFVEGLIPVRAFLFCFTSFPNPGRTNSPSFGSFVGDGVGDLRSLRDCCGLGV